MSSHASRHSSAIRTAIAANIRAARKAQGLRQRDLAALLDTDAMSVSRWERGIARPNAEYEAQLVDVLFDGDLVALYTDPKPEIAA